ncbi:MAG: SRPBCC domain-containing protein [Cytophagales bacterium]|nr:SRPBCC domain-containing protein [Cytophagales bacterium]
MSKADCSSLDLTLTRIVDVPKEAVWRCWTEPALLLPWFCPQPWKTIACEIDLRPGGIFSSTMQSPEGVTMPTGVGCYLEIIPNQRLTWTNALLPHYRPSLTLEKCGSDDAGFLFTATIDLQDHKTDTGLGTRYTATVLHADAASAAKHAAMGFEAGWGAALDQMVAMIKQGI